MAQTLINIGTTVNDRSGDPIRTAFSKINDNFTELYTSTIPAQTGNGGLYLSTDGTTLHWSPISVNPILPTNAPGFLTNNGSGVLSWVNQSLGNYVFNGNTVTNTTAASISLQTNSHSWTFGASGNLTLPGDGYGIIFDSLSSAAITVGMGALVLQSPDINLRATDGTITATWQFQTSGGLLFPNNSIQTTAWTGSVAYVDVTGTPILSTVATSGSYSDLLNIPTFATVATSGSYSDLLNAPILSTVATSGSYADLLNIPSFATVATSGSYADLINAPILSTVATSGSYTDLINAPILSTVATSGSYSDLLNIPSFATVATSGSYSDLLNAPILSTVATSGSYSDLLNAPILSTVATSGSYADLLNAPILSTVATSGSYSDLSNTPSFATVATSGSYADLLNAPILSTVATSGSYTDLLNIPSFATVATSGSYSDLLNAPFIPNLGNLTISDQTISGTNINGDIELTPNGTGFVSTPNLKLPLGTLFQTTGAIDVIVAPLIFSSVVDFSIGGNELSAGSYGNPNAIPAPWTVYQFTTDPSPILEINDWLAGAGVPTSPLSTVRWVGTGTYASYVVIDSNTFEGTDPILLPQPNEPIYITRPIVNAGLVISTADNTDITLNAGPGGYIVPHTSIIPFTHNVFSIGTPTKRFKDIWLGAGTIYVLDETRGSDIAIGARDGNLYVAGAAGLTVGAFTFVDKTIAINSPTSDVSIGNTNDSGNLLINRPLKVVSGMTGNVSFSATRDGLVSIKTPQTLLTTESALSIIGSSSGHQYPRNFTGTLLQLTGQDNTPARVSIDSFGSANYGVIAGRQARGTVDSPSATLQNDTLLRFSSQGYGDTGFIPTIGRINLQATQDFTDTAAGTRIRFQATPANSVIIQSITADIDATGLSFIGNATGGITFNDSTRQTTAWTGTANQATFGNIQISGDTILDTVTGNELYITTSDNGGGVTITGDHLYVKTTTNSAPLFSVNSSGTIDINVPSWDSGIAAVSIDASPGTNQINPNNPGVVLQTTGLDGTPSRIYNDGSATYPAYIGRRYNGTTANPSGVTIGDIISRFGATPYLNNSSFSSMSTARMDFVATEIQTPTNQGNHIEFWTTPNGSTTIEKYLSISDNGITFSDGTSQNTAAIPLTEMGIAGGVATLGLDGKVLTTQLPSGAVIYQGAWDASINSPMLTNGSGITGWEYSISVGGVVDFGAGPITFQAGDYVIYNGTIWQQIPGTNSVSSFNGRIGAVVLSTLDVSNALTYTPYNGTINPNGYVDNAGAKAAAPVQTVFGRQGNVTLTTSDVTNVLNAGTITNTMLAGSIANSKLANNSITISTSGSLSGGGTVALGGTITLSSTGGITETVVTGNNSASYNLLPSDQYFGTIYSITGPSTIILPLGASTVVGKMYTIKDEGGHSQSGTHRVTLQTSGSDKIDGGTYVKILTNYGSLRVIWTGTMWSTI